MYILDLFAGKGGELRRPIIEGLGHHLTTLDINKDFHCDITADIMEIDDLGLYDFIWASPPCETWSVASIGHHWNRDNTPKTKEAEYGIRLVRHTIDLMQSSAKTAWLIENPRGKLRKMDFMKGIPRDTVTYCQYGEKRMKPTDIWHVGLNWIPRPMCKNGDVCHDRVPRSSGLGTESIKAYADKAIVPTELWLEILDAIVHPQIRKLSYSEQLGWSL